MRNFTIYPAIDLRMGQVVRLSQGKSNQQTIYSDSPDEVANGFIQGGAEWLHVVNLDGAFGEPFNNNQKAIQDIVGVGSARVKIQLGGGLRMIDQIAAAIDLGVSRIVLGTAIIEEPVFGEKVLRIFGGERIALGFDALGQKLMSRGWKIASDSDMVSLAQRFADAGAKTLIYTNVLKDGMQTGVDWETAMHLSDQTGMDVIASGGTSSLKDIETVRNAGLAGVIIGRALYEGNFSLKDAINVR